MLNNWFNIDSFMPHGHCFLWNPGLLWSMVLGNAVIALSYFSIPIALLVTMRRQQSRHMKWVFVMFSAFIFACGMTHVIRIVTIWYPDYYLEAVVMVATAVVSATTAIALWPIVGRARAYIANQEITTEILMNTNQQLKESIGALKQHHVDFQALNRMSGYIEVCNDLEEVSTTIIDTIAQLWPESSGSIFLLDPRANEFTPAGQWGEATQGETIEAHTCWSYRLSTPFPDKDTQIHHQCLAANCGIRRKKMCLPVSAGGETLGLLHLEGIAIPLDERARTILPLLVERAGFAIYSMRLQQSLEFKSTRDALTELFNRHYMDEALQIEIDRAQRSQDELSVVMFDLDYFKRLNDTHGHEIGDRALRMFARILRSSLRTGDMACRYGGEEFVLILPTADLDQATEIADRIRVVLATSTAEPDIDPAFANMTASAGVASLSPDCATAKDLLNQADQALYQAKEAGRNQVRSLRDPLPVRQAAPAV